MSSATVALLAALGAGAATLSGVVRTAGIGTPVSGAKILVLAADGSQDRLDSAVTDNGGEYTIAGLRRGNVLVRATQAGYQDAQATVEIETNSGSYTANFSLVGIGNDRTGDIAGQIVDAATDARISGATVILSHPNGQGQTLFVDTVTTNAEGRYFISNAPAAAGYSISVTASNYQAASKTGITVADGGTADVDFKLTRIPPPSGRISGKVTQATAATAIAGAQVILRRRSVVNQQVVWTPLDTVLTQADGNYAFTELPVATEATAYSLVTSMPDYATATSANITLAQGESKTVNVSLTRLAKGTLFTTVARDTAGRPAIAGATVIAVQQNGDAVYTGTTDSKGLAKMESLLSGTYVVTVSAAGFVSESATRTLGNNENDSATVLLVRATAGNSKTLSGVVRDEDGKAVAGAKVFAQVAASDFSVMATTSATGDYLIAGIPSNISTVSVRVEVSGFAASVGNAALALPVNYFNVNLEKPVAIAPSLRSPSAFRVIPGIGGLTVEFASSPWAGRIAAYDIRGALAFSAPVSAGATVLRLPGRASLRYLVLERGGMVERLQVAQVR